MLKKDKNLEEKSSQLLNYYIIAMHTILYSNSDYPVSTLFFSLHTGVLMALEKLRGPIPGPHLQSASESESYNMYMHSLHIN